MNRKEILDSAKKCICGDRPQDYGSPENNFGVIADLWNAYLKTAKPWVPTKCIPLFTASDVGVLMCLFKLGRIASGTGNMDSFIDLAGYAACAGELRENEMKEDQE